MLGATTTGWCPGSGSRSTLECWNTGTAAHTVAASLVPDRRSTLDSGAAVTLRLEPGALLSRHGHGDGPGRTRAPTSPYFRLPGARAGHLRLERRRRRGCAASRSGRRSSSADFVLDGAARTSREVSLRLNDQARGEVRRPLTVVPRVDVDLDPGTELWPAGSRAPRRFTVTLTHGARDTTAGTVALEVPRGWPAVRPQALPADRARTSARR